MTFHNIFLHLDLSQASSLQSPSSLISSLNTSLHLFLALPFTPSPSTCSVPILFIQHNSSLLSTWPNHLNLFRRMTSAMICENHNPFRLRHSNFEDFLGELVASCGRFTWMMESVGKRNVPQWKHVLDVLGYSICFCVAPERFLYFGMDSDWQRDSILHSTISNIFLMRLYFMRSFWYWQMILLWSFVIFSFMHTSNGSWSTCVSTKRTMSPAKLLTSCLPVSFPFWRLMNVSLVRASQPGKNHHSLVLKCFWGVICGG